jgi:hypothetical protein
VTTTAIAAYGLVLGLFAAAFLLVAASQFLMIRSFARLRALHPAKWQDLGAPAVLGRNPSRLKAVADYLYSEEADELGDAVLVRRARLARRLNYTGAVLFFLWFVLWVWSIS